MTPEHQIPAPPPTAERVGQVLARWLDLRNWVPRTTGPSAALEGASLRDDARIDWARVLPFLGMHAACLAVIWVGFSWTALAATIALYLVRMFAITGFYHRYFSHRTFKTSRVGQFVFGLLGASAVQRGPIWWAAHHRHHHVHSDKPEDVHSPVHHGFFWCHMGWFMSRQHFATDVSRVRDLLKYPELRFLDRFDVAVPTVLGVGVFLLGTLLRQVAPGLGTSGWQMLVWGFFISTVAVYHGTYTINSLSHVFGRQRYRTGDQSRNNLWLALITLGEGWHNNHHHYPASVRQGFYWWELDFTYYVLKLMALCGLIWDLKPVPVAVRDGAGRRF
ncbi:MAG: acyl-CoA desaturase [Steroidobacteraceae bacterium]